MAEIIGVDEIPFYQVDIRDKASLEFVFAEHKFDACIHFAGLKAVGESVEKPLIKVNGVEVPYSIKPRRAGDIATCYCDPAKAELGWKAKFGIEEMVRDSWMWQRGESGRV